MTQIQAPDPTTGLDWIEVGPLMAIPPLGARVVKHPSGEIAVFRNREDEVFALRNHCPHRGGPLSEGIVCERRVYCPLHNWGIALETGSALAPDEGETAPRVLTMARYSSACQGVGVPLDGARG